MDLESASRSENAFLSDTLKKAKNIYFIGIKGTGMAALAELLHKRLIHVSGSDHDEVFYTDDILRELGIPFYESFDAAHIKSGGLPDLVIHSAAYSPQDNVEMAEAQRLGIPLFKYSDALGAYSAGFDSTAIAGVHGKTTLTALAGTLLRGLNLPAQILAGSAVLGFGGRSTLNLGEKYFVAETCEYRRHFLSFFPQRIILTNVESDHLDYFPTYKDIRDAFMELGNLLPPGGELVYCADDPGACEVALALKKQKPEIILIPYGFSAAGEFKIETYEVRDERLIMRLRGFQDELRLRIPGRHTVLNTAGAVALCALLVRKEFGKNDANMWDADIWTEERRNGLVNALEAFNGSKRRSEILGQVNEILFMDDYGHHPTEIKTTLEGLKDFYPNRRIVLSFMSHTYTRTSMLLDEFAASFAGADIIVLHKIYASAREVYSGGVTGKTLFEKTREILSDFDTDGTERVFYVEEYDNACGLLKDLLRPGDLFITMGAGDNWKLGKKLFDFFQNEARAAFAVRSAAILPLIE